MSDKTLDKIIGGQAAWRAGGAFVVRVFAKNTCALVTVMTQNGGKRHRDGDRGSVQTPLGRTDERLIARLDRG